MGMKIQLLLMALSIPLILSKRPYNYCEIPSCEYRAHTLCIYNVVPKAPRCGHVIKSRLTETEKARIVILHNNIRRKVLSGQENRGLYGPQPRAQNITLLQWHDELARIAERWSEQCINGIDRCRNAEKFEVNQNVDGDKSRESLENLKIDKIIKKWHDEVVNFDSREVQQFSEYNALIAGTHHYTQIVWENTKYIGCAAMRYFDRRYYRLLLVCNYGPKGNNNGEPVYRVKSKENRETKKIINY